MFDIGWSELLVVGVVALIVVGPKELPGLLRSLGRAIATVRRMAGEFQGQFNEAMREAELDELRKEVDALRSTASGYLKVPDVPSIVRNEVRSAIQGSAPTAASTPAPNSDPSMPEAGALEAPGAGTEAREQALPSSAVPVEAALHEPAPAAQPADAGPLIEPALLPDTPAPKEPQPGKPVLP